MDIIIYTIIYGSIDIVFEAIGWGTFGYVFLRFLGFKEKYWYCNWLIIFLAFLFWDIWANTYLMKLDISIGNKEVLAFLDNDLDGLFGTDFFDIFFNATEIFLGYLIGRYIFKRAMAKP